MHSFSKYFQMSISKIRLIENSLCSCLILPLELVLLTQHRESDMMRSPLLSIAELLSQTIYIDSSPPAMFLRHHINQVLQYKWQNTLEESTVFQLGKSRKFTMIRKVFWISFFPIFLPFLWSHHSNACRCGKYWPQISEHLSGPQILPSLLIFDVRYSLFRSIRSPPPPVSLLSIVSPRYFLFSFQLVVT